MENLGFTDLMEALASIVGSVNAYQANLTPEGWSITLGRDDFSHGIRLSPSTELTDKGELTGRPWPSMSGRLKPDLISVERGTGSVPSATTGIRENVRS
jgi:hypothetical protein